MDTIYALAPAPVRATTTVTLAAGLLTIPLSVYTSTETTRVERKEFFNGDSTVPVGRAPIRKDTEAIVHQTDVTRMAQADTGAWVILTDDEIAACTSPRGLAEVETFVPVESFDRYLTEGLYQVRPKREKGKLNPAVERTFSLLLAGMASKGVGALVKLALRGPARYAILTSTGELRMILTADAVRQAQPLDSPDNLPAREVEMVGNLIDAIGIDAPVITDDTAPEVQAFVNGKAQGVAAPAPTAAPTMGVDVLAALEASIAAATKAKAKGARKGGKAKVA